MNPITVPATRGIRFPGKRVMPANGVAYPGSMPKMPTMPKMPVMPKMPKMK